MRATRLRYKFAFQFVYNFSLLHFYVYTALLLSFLRSRKQFFLHPVVPRSELIHFNDGNIMQLIVDFYFR